VDPCPDSSRSSHRSLSRVGKFRGVRGWAGKPTHPPLTDFPIAAYVLAAAFDLISYFAGDGGASTVARDAFAAATYVTIGGAVLSLVTAITGFWDWWKGIDRDRSGRGWLGRARHTHVWRTVNAHALIMVTATVLVLVEIVVRLSQYGAGSTGLPVLILSVIVGCSFCGGASTAVSSSTTTSSTWKASRVRRSGTRRSATRCPARGSGLKAERGSPPRWAATGPLAGEP
jgi:uncharacterized membrane protein